MAGQLPFWVDALAHRIEAHPSEVLLLDKFSLLAVHLGGKHLVAAWLARDVLAKILTHITTSHLVEHRYDLICVCHSHWVGPHGIDRLIHDELGRSSTIHGVYLTALGTQAKLLDLLAISLRHIVVVLQQLHIPQAQHKHHKQPTEHSGERLSAWRSKMALQHGLLAGVRCSGWCCHRFGHTTTLHFLKGSQTGVINL